MFRSRSLLVSWLFSERCKGGNCLDSYSVIVSPTRRWLPLFAHFVCVCLSPSLSGLGSVEQSLLFPKPGHRPEGLKSLKSVTGCLHFTSCSLFHTVAVARFEYSQVSRPMTLNKNCLEQWVQRVFRFYERYIRGKPSSQKASNNSVQHSTHSVVCGLNSISQD